LRHLGQVVGGIKGGFAGCHQCADRQGGTEAGEDAVDFAGGGGEVFEIALDGGERSPGLVNSGDEDLGAVGCHGI